MKPISLHPTTEQNLKRREERRAKQRSGNVGRAIKMHAARLAQEKEGFLFNAPVPLVEATMPRLNIGCSGWFYWDWKDRFYPPTTMTKEWFAYYASQFETVELNASFYSWPTIAAVQNWIRQVKGQRFFYTIKVCELITHQRQFVRTADFVKDFGFIASLLKPHMGCLLFQFPSTFEYSAARLKRILDQLDPGHRNVVEFRHGSWWSKQTTMAFEKTGTIFCSCSAPRLPDDLVRTTDEVYIRFHGTSAWYRHNYTKAELVEWVNKIRKHKPKRIWAYFNNAYEGHAPHNAHELTQLLVNSDG